MYLKAASNDVLATHPLLHIEAEQFKSSEYITRGYIPEADLEVGKQGNKDKKTIWGEWKKATNSEHVKWYKQFNPNYHFALFIISNKSLKNYETHKKVKVRPDKESPLYKTSLPAGVGVICNQNFAKYAGCFAHQGIFIEAEATQTNRPEASEVIPAEKSAEEDESLSDDDMVE